MSSQSLASVAHDLIGQYAQFGKLTAADAQGLYSPQAPAACCFSVRWRESAIRFIPTGSPARRLPGHGQ